MTPNSTLSDQGTIYPQSLTLTFLRKSFNPITSLTLYLTISGIEGNDLGCSMVLSLPSLTYSLYPNGDFVRFYGNVSLNYENCEGRIVLKDHGTDSDGKDDFQRACKHEKNVDALLRRPQSPIGGECTHSLVGLRVLLSHAALPGYPFVVK